MKVEYDITEDEKEKIDKMLSRKKDDIAKQNIMDKPLSLSLNEIFSCSISLSRDILYDRLGNTIVDTIVLTKQILLELIKTKITTEEYNILTK